MRRRMGSDQRFASLYQTCKKYNDTQLDAVQKKMLDIIKLLPKIPFAASHKIIARCASGKNE
jgi:hypothetical protein